jgi:hypothetical protein
VPDDLGLQLRESATGRDVQFSERFFPDTIGSVQLPNEKLTVGENGDGLDYDFGGFERPVASRQQGLVFRCVVGPSGQVLRQLFDKLARVGVSDYDAGVTPAKLTGSINCDLEIHLFLVFLPGECVWR